MTKCQECIILIKDCPGKQVEILYEPVAVRHKVYTHCYAYLNGNCPAGSRGKSALLSERVTQMPQFREKPLESMIGRSAGRKTIPSGRRITELRRPASIHAESEYPDRTDPPAVSSRGRRLTEEIQIEGELKLCERNA